MLDTVKEMAHKHFQGARGSHNWDHTLRVYRLCEHLGAAEGVDLDVLWRNSLNGLLKRTKEKGEHYGNEYRIQDRQSG
jgi:hypothetical protein